MTVDALTLPPSRLAPAAEKVRELLRRCCPWVRTQQPGPDVVEMDAPTWPQSLAACTNVEQAQLTAEALMASLDPALPSVRPFYDLAGQILLICVYTAAQMDEDESVVRKWLGGCSRAETEMISCLCWIDRYKSEPDARDMRMRLDEFLEHRYAVREDVLATALMALDATEGRANERSERAKQAVEREAGREADRRRERDTMTALQAQAYQHGLSPASLMLDGLERATN